jgi:hypothetical protein
MLLWIVIAIFLGGFSFMVKTGFRGWFQACIYAQMGVFFLLLQDLCACLVLFLKTFFSVLKWFFSSLFSIIRFMLIGVGFLYETSGGW